LNVGIDELIWRSLEIFRNLRKLCAIYSETTMPQKHQVTVNQNSFLKHENEINSHHISKDIKTN
jgi:hypothetical protein